MKFHFEPNLKFQLEAINAVTNLFEGAMYTRPEERLLNEVAENVLKLPQEQVLKNRDEIIQRNEIDVSYAKPVSEMDFCIEMETGTGKTYVYLRTIYELFLKYGLSKFIIIVPSIAVKEGVLKTLEMTKKHFFEIYNVMPEVIEYNSKKTNKVRGFCYSNHLSIMIMNTQAFNSDDNIINLERDTNNGEKLIDLIEATNPIFILDEPQEGMDSANMVNRFKALNPLFKLRYSATHKIVKNLIHRLTPFDAYNQKLVKTVQVLSIHETNTQSNVLIDFEDIKLFEGGKAPQAELKLNFRTASGDFKTKIASFKELDDLEAKTKNPVYKGWVVERIRKDPFTDETTVKFSNGIELQKGKKHGFDKESIFREQIKRTIENHFKIKEKLQPKGIKTLSLFFIDRVANYVEEEGMIRKLFIELYKEIYEKKFGKEPTNISEIHDGYFAKTSSQEYTDNEASMRKNKEIYDKILKNKEKLLSFDEPLEFIFSHSALGVGWDNPNVFNICTLNESESLIKKRQEIGRGLRICVNQDGERVRDDETTKEGEEINLLTVIANQSYESFVQTYQQELIEEYGENIKLTKPRNARESQKEVKLNKLQFESEDFKKLWSKISRKTAYRMFFHEEDIIEKCVKALDSIVVQENYLKIELNQISKMENPNSGSGYIFHDRNLGETDAAIHSRKVSIDLVEAIANETDMSASTVEQVLKKMLHKKQIIKNPMLWLSEAINRIKRILAEEMVRLVKYEISEEDYGPENFEPVIATYKETVSVRNGLYDKIIHESDTERDLSLELDQQNKVRVFLKLPDWYKIPTPIGSYTPDFALVIEKQDLDVSDEQVKTKYYFTIEAKGSKEWKDLREDEKIKIRCAVKHFEAIGLKEYLYPIESLQTFDQKAYEKTGKTFFN